MMMMMLVLQRDLWHRKRTILTHGGRGTGRIIPSSCWLVIIRCLQLMVLLLLLEVLVLLLHLLLLLEDRGQGSWRRHYWEEAATWRKLRQREDWRSEAGGVSGDVTRDLNHLGGRGRHGRRRGTHSITGEDEKKKKKKK